MSEEALLESLEPLRDMPYFNQLLASEDEMKFISNVSWGQTLSQGGLSVLSIQWRNQCPKLYVWFYDFHRYSPHHLKIEHIRWSIEGIWLVFNQKISGHSI